MSFDIFLTAITDDDEFDRSLVERAFKGMVAQPSDDDWTLRTPTGEKTSVWVSIDATPKIRGFAVNRPPSFSGFPEFWNAMFEVMAQTRTILFWPGEGPHPRGCIANPAVRRELPRDFIEALGEPALASSGADIYPAIELSAC